MRHSRAAASLFAVETMVLAAKPQTSRQKRRRPDTTPVLPRKLYPLGNSCRSPAENTRSPKPNLMVSSAPFQADAPPEVAVKTRFSSSEPILTAQSGLSCQTNPTPENPVKSRFFSPKPLQTAQNGLSHQRNRAWVILVKSRFLCWNRCRR